MLTDVARLTAMQDYALTVWTTCAPAASAACFPARYRRAAWLSLPQDWLCRVQARLRAPCERPLGTDAGGYLPPDGQPLPGKAPGTIPGCRRWKGWPCATGANRRRTRPLIRPLLEDHLTLNIRI